MIIEGAGAMSNALHETLTVTDRKQLHGTLRSSTNCQVKLRLSQKKNCVKTERLTTQKQFQNILSCVHQRLFNLAKVAKNIEKGLT